ncbi:MAG: hypothetical protein JNK65_09265 [Deltaproteobacteria bacterium]|nr:hypothetical protein [Deltaproteobacteria bacterium]
MTQPRFVTQQSLTFLLQEIELALRQSDSLYPQIIQTLKELGPFLNFKEGSSLHSLEAKKRLGNLRESLKDYKNHLKRMVAAYQELSLDLQNVLAGRGMQDVIVQEFSRQGSQLAQEIQQRQSLESVLSELGSVLDRICVQEKSTPSQQKKIEDLIFRLQLITHNP